jgi:hypothetical protein
MSDHKYLEVMIEKDRIELFEQEILNMTDQISQKKDYFNLQFNRIKNMIDLSAF